VIGFQRVPALADIHQSVLGRTPGTEVYRATLQTHVAATEQWLGQAKQVLSATAAQTLDPLPASPTFPASLVPFQSHQDPTMLYNGMIHALVGFPIRGAIWYQGESNHGEGMLYFEKKKALVNGWRELWHQGDFPFYFVQIAPYQYGNESPDILAEFWEAQAACQQIPNTGMVVINDIATLADIHPPNKQDVGLRLAQLALHHNYNRPEIVAHSPEMSDIKVLPGKLRVTFQNTGGGLKTRDGKAPSHFEVIGPGSQGFQPAVATIDGDAIVLESDAVAEPVAFRFAWHKLAEPNLTGATGLPVGACRGGKVPEFTELIADFDKYQLVYDLDLNQLGPKFKYQKDNSQSIKSFDRIAYLLELQSAERGDQKILVAMDAFTTAAGKIGIPTVASQASFATEVANLEIFTNVSGLPNGVKRGRGHIEFWPNNYGPANAQKVSGATDNAYDFGDEISPPLDGYGCMQVHDTESKQTLFAINHWNQAATADIGIGNSPGQHKDWTFTGNANSYSQKRLRVYVRAL
jgi:sialate O-acetylesterase